MTNNVRKMREREKNKEEEEQKRPFFWSVVDMSTNRQ
jgi:hypothetical protein